MFKRKKQQHISLKTLNSDRIKACKCEDSQLWVLSLTDSCRCWTETQRTNILLSLNYSWSVGAGPLKWGGCVQGDHLCCCSSNLGVEFQSADPQVHPREALISSDGVNLAELVLPYARAYGSVGLVVVQVEGFLREKAPVSAVWLFTPIQPRAVGPAGQRQPVMLAHAQRQ